MEFRHVQTNQVFPVFTQFERIRIGKFLEPEEKDINLIDLPNADIVSRIHLYLYVNAARNSCDIEDQGSSNGTFLNGKQLSPFQRQSLENGDRIDLGKDGKMTLIFTDKLNPEVENISPDSSVSPIATVLQKTAVQIGVLSNPKGDLQGDRPLFSLDDFKKLNPRVSRFLGIAFLVAGIIYFSSIMRIGFSFNAYVLIFWGLGGYLLFQKNISKEWGWLLIGAGVVIVLLQGQVFAMTNLLGLIISVALFWASYFFFENSKGT